MKTINTASKTVRITGISGINSGNHEFIVKKGIQLIFYRYKSALLIHPYMRFTHEEYTMYEDDILTKTVQVFNAGTCISQPIFNY